MFSTAGRARVQVASLSQYATRSSGPDRQVTVTYYRAASESDSMIPFPAGHSTCQGNLKPEDDSSESRSESRATGTLIRLGPAARDCSRLRLRARAGCHTVTGKLFRVTDT